MVLCKKGLTMLGIIITALLLVACGGKENSGQAVEEEPIYDNPRNYTAEDYLPLSEGLEEHPVWFKTDVYPTRNSSVSYLYVFENGIATMYWNFDGLSIEKINDLTDDEIIKYVQEKSTAKETGKYTLDITLDELGQSTKEIKVILKSGTREYFWPKGYNLDGEILTEDKTSTEEIEDGKALVTFIPGAVNQKVFNTTYSGLGYDEYYSLFTRVDDSFVGFKLDDPNTKKKNVTIEGK